MSECAQRPAALTRKPRLDGLVRKIISGGQTGADRAALDWAIRHGFEHGGWCPRDRRAEDGVLGASYLLQETASRSYRERTRLNVTASDGTLIVNLGDLDGGSLDTMEIARDLGKPVLLMQTDSGISAADIDRGLDWLRGNHIVVLNIAGPRESKRPGTYQRTWDLLDRLARA